MGGEAEHVARSAALTWTLPVHVSHPILVCEADRFVLVRVGEGRPLVWRCPVGRTDLPGRTQRHTRRREEEDADTCSRRSRIHS